MFAEFHLIVGHIYPVIDETMPFSIGHTNFTCYTDMLYISMHIESLQIVNFSIIYLCVLKKRDNISSFLVLFNCSHHSLR